jgi:uncharacterized protein (UPF0548 family)
MPAPLLPRIEWFPRPTNDARFLNLWREATLTYTRGDEAHSKGWHIDDHAHVITPNGTEALFTRAARLLWLYQIYPKAIVEPLGVFQRERRLMQVGDAIVQRIHAVRLFGFPWVDVVTMTRVASLTDEPRVKGFSYITTTAHMEIGEGRAHVEWRADNALVLVLHAVSKPGPRMPFWATGYARYLQQTVYQQGPKGFAAQVLAT